MFRLMRYLRRRFWLTAYGRIHEAYLEKYRNSNYTIQFEFIAPWKGKYFNAPFNLLKSLKEKPDERPPEQGQGDS